MAIYWYIWEETDINWENMDLNWEDAKIVTEVTKILGSGGPISGTKIPDHLKLKELNKLPKEKKKKIIKLAFKLAGKEDEYITYSKEQKGDIIVTAEHVQIILDELNKNKIVVDVQNIS